MPSSAELGVGSAVVEAVMVEVERATEGVGSVRAEGGLARSRVGKGEVEAEARDVGAAEVLGALSDKCQLLARPECHSKSSRHSSTKSLYPPSGLQPKMASSRSYSSPRQLHC